ncbi:DUF4296 domain-containing protein [Psychroserpens sp. BH13MA-6]
MKKLCLLILIAALFGCYSSGKPKKPDNLIPRDKMVDVLYEVFIISAAKGGNKLKLENKGIYPQDYIFEKYHIDSLQFALSNEYYGYDVSEYELMISEIEERIKSDKEKYEKAMAEEAKEIKRKKDSMKMAIDSTQKIKADKVSIKSDR